MPPAKTMSPPSEKVVDGPVKKVDPMAKTVQVGWFLGLFNTTLDVTEDTRIAVEGAKASLQDIREGDRVKAAYAEQDGKNIAKSIEVTQAETPKASPGATRSPESGAPMGTGGSAPTGTKTP
jgi:Cu/Ag efflux protein CusF